MKFDVIIIGGGAAGISSALWCDDLGLNALLLERDEELGGQLLWTHNRIENHLGVAAENGSELRDIFVRQLNKRKFTLHLNAEIVDIELKEKKVRLASGEEFSAGSIIIATGISRRRLDIPGEKEFSGKGIITSGKRDGDLAKGKHAVIVGGGDAAFENALILSEVAEKVTLIHRREGFSARREFTDPVKDISNVEILTDTHLLKIEGDNKVEAVEIKNTKTGSVSKLLAGIVLVRIGVKPNTDILKGLVELDDRGYIKIDHLCRTSIKDIYAVGDVANPTSLTVSTAVGNGATAVKKISSLLIS